MYEVIFLLGLAGSIHCSGMCGPLTLVAPVNREYRRLMLRDMSIYHISRIAVYALLGAIIGSMGQLFSISRFQSGTAVLFGILMVAWGLSYYLPLGRDRFMNAMGIDRIFVRLYNRYFTRSSAKNLVVLGMLNGILPCGLVYSAMAMAFLGGNLVSGALQMVVFGMGTIPLLFALQLGAGNRSIYTFFKQKGLTPALFMISGAFVIYKAISIYIPREAGLLNSMADPIMCH